MNNESIKENFEVIPKFNVSKFFSIHIIKSNVLFYYVICYLLSNKNFEKT